MLLTNYAMCGSKRQRLFIEQETTELLSSLEIKNANSK